jgi:hypothetical protein
MLFLRIVLIVHVIGVLALAVFAGQFLSGVDGAVYRHEVAGWSVLALCLLQIAIAVSLRIPRGGTLPFAVWSALTFLAEALQAGTGYGRFLEVHVPLGMLILGSIAAQLVWLLRA